MAAVEYRIAVLIAVALKFVVILFCDLSESEFNKVEIQNGGKIAVQILERLDFLCFFHQVFLFCFQFCTLLVQLAKGVIQTMDTVDGIFQESLFVVVRFSSGRSAVKSSACFKVSLYGLIWIYGVIFCIVDSSVRAFSRCISYFER